MKVFIMQLPRRYCASYHYIMQIMKPNIAYNGNRALLFPISSLLTAWLAKLLYFSMQCYGVPDFMIFRNLVSSAFLSVKIFHSS
jgi:hypothetical protein